jgi:hypothetical protein
MGTVIMDAKEPRRIMSREWFALLPWDFIYALGVIATIAPLFAFVISHVF